MLTIPEIQKRAYATACAKGWHDNPLRVFYRDVVDIADWDRTDNPASIDHDRVLRSHALMHTEITEALDALAHGELSMWLDGEKPEGFVVELADVVIRVCDTTAALGIDIDVQDTWLSEPSLRAVSLNLREAPSKLDRALRLHHYVGLLRCDIDRATEAARVDDWPAYADFFGYALRSVAAICTGLDLDLGAAIEAKMRYNETRSHRHGGKQA